MIAFNRSNIKQIIMIFMSAPHQINHTSNIYNVDLEIIVFMTSDMVTCIHVEYKEMS